MIRMAETTFRVSYVLKGMRTKQMGKIENMAIITTKARKIITKKKKKNQEGKYKIIWQAQRKRYIGNHLMSYLRTI